MRVVETYEFYAELEDYLQWVKRQVLDADMGEEIFLGDITVHDMTLEEWEAIPEESEIEENA